MKSLKRLGLAAMLALTGCAAPYKISTTPDSNELTDFVDTKKPNAVVVFPISDHNLAFYNYREEEFLYHLAEKYDVYAIIAENENEVYSALNKMNKSGVDVLLLNGHGSPESLCLSIAEDEKYCLDTSDFELKESLKCLNKGAEIFLFSCNTGKDKNKGKNLANFLADISKRKVIAPDGIPKQRIARFRPPFALDFYADRKVLGFIPWSTNITYRTN
ncbi:MAG: DUF4347 domain-containing protein [Nanoarchaeota archaeon]